PAVGRAFRAGYGGTGAEPPGAAPEDHVVARPARLPVGGGAVRIGYLVGALNAGGSERQLIYLASGMAAGGHEVEIFCYDGSGEFDELAERNGLRLRVETHRSRVGKLLAVRRWLRELGPDVVHGIMKRASSLAILADLPASKRRVVATDLSTATFDPGQRALRAALRLYRFADVVATQTEVNRRSLLRLGPWLEGKVRVVRNGIDLERFRPAPEAVRGEGPVRFLVVGTAWRAKNPVEVVRAAAIVRDRSARPFRVDWVGRVHRQGSGEPIPEYAAAARAVEELGLEGVVEFAGPTDRVEEAYRSADVLLHASIQDGIPNAVVEGMASGLPIVVSPVSDLPLIVEAGDNGFVSDGFEAEPIAAAMLRMLETSPAERAAMGRRSRELAERWFGLDRFVAEYEALYREILGSGA
ncbi:MAG TPA: glycosyltransferase family 1 protein, partial [Acidobacteria bacterium]|nr:glycosyltransferase family 1 protein [Acidobacteriota bacterium]